MALGWKTEYEKSLPAGELSNWEIFILLGRACKNLDWEYLVVDENHFTATTPVHWTLSEEIITVTRIGNQIVFKSQSESLELYEGGRNKKNLEELLIPQFLSLQQNAELKQLSQDAVELKKEIQSQIKNGRVAGERITFGLRDHEVTFFLILLNLGVFIAMVAQGTQLYNPSPADITFWGGNVKEYVISGDWWRLITNLFVQVGVRLLIANMVGLYFIGIMVETILGKIKFLIAFLTTGALASLVSIYFSGEGVTAGATGAIAGLYGVLIAFSTTGYVNKKFNAVWFTGVVLYFVFVVWIGLLDGADNKANIGGLAAGILVGYLFYFFHFRKNLARAGGTRISIEIMLAAALLIFLYISNAKDDSLLFEKAVMKLNQIELKAMSQMQKLQDAKTNEDAAFVLKEQALPLWKNFENEIDKTDKYRLDEVFNRKRVLLHRYAQLRVKLTELIYLSITEDTDKYDQKIKSTSDEIELLIDQLGQ